MLNLDQIEHALSGTPSFMQTVESVIGGAAELLGLHRTGTVLTPGQRVRLDVRADRADEVLANYRDAVIIAVDSGRMIARTEAFVLPERLPGDAAHRLNSTNEPLGRIVYPLGVTRHTLGVRRLANESAFGSDTPLFRVWGRLDHVGVPVALVVETLLGTCLPTFAQDPAKTTVPSASTVSPGLHAISQR